jgi:hypothetical protein
MFHEGKRLGCYCALAVSLLSTLACSSRSVSSSDVAGAPEQPATETPVPPTSTSLPTPTEPPPTTEDPPQGFFHVEDGKIFDPEGREFVMNAVTTVYGTFGGGDEAGYGEFNYQHAQDHYDQILSLGFNTVRIYVHADNYDQAHKARLLNAVQWGRDRGFLVIISSHYGDYNPTSIAMLTDLVQVYKDDPYVWITPASEPYCGDSVCLDWDEWYQDHLAYVQLLRDNGYQNPILINTVHWSSDLSRIYEYPLGDDNLVYGARRYGNDHQTFDSSHRQQVEAWWGTLAQDSQFAFVIDEVGAYNGRQFANSIDWVRGFMDYTTDWVNNRGGDGIIPFVWYWSDGNSLTNRDGSLTPWGNIFVDQYLDRVRSPE